MTKSLGNVSLFLLILLLLSFMTFLVIDSQLSVCMADGDEYANLIEAVEDGGAGPVGGFGASGAASLIESFTSPIGYPMEMDYDAARGGVWIASESGEIARVGVGPGHSTQFTLSLVGIAIATNGFSNGICVLPNGNLLLSDYRGGGGNIGDYLFEIDPDTGTLLNYWPVDDAWNTSTDGTSIDKVFGVEMGPNGHAYVTSAGDNFIYEIELTSPGKPGTWRTVAVHTPTTVSNIAGIDRINCPRINGWLVGDWDSTNVAFLGDAFTGINAFAANHDGNIHNLGVTAVTSTNRIPVWCVDFTTNMIGIFDSGEVCYSSSNRKYLHSTGGLFNLTDPLDTQWHELWPFFSKEYHLSSWNDTSGNSALSRCDWIDMYEKPDGAIKPYHVEDVTITLNVTHNETGDRMFIELEGGYDPRVLIQPLGSQWHEIYPVFCREYQLVNMQDGGKPIGQLSFCDDIMLQNKHTGEPTWWHVEEVAVDIIVTPEPPPVGGEAYPVGRASLLAPWIAVGLVLAGGASWYFLRRRKAQS